MGLSDRAEARTIPDNIVEIMRAEQAAEGRVAAYPSYLWQKKFLHSRVRRSLFQLSTLVEPMDRALGRQAGQPHAKAFYYGSLLGMRVTAECVDDIDTAFDGISLGIGMVKDADDLHARHILASELMNIGGASYAAVAGTFEPLFDDWDEHLAPDGTRQAYLHNGFGLPLSYLFARHEFDAAARLQADLADMRSELAHADTLDWDQLLR